MKTLILIFIAYYYLSIGILSGQDPTAFITTWQTDNPGASCTTCIAIPTLGTGYSYDVDWDNDGTYDDFGVSGDIIHDYGTAGTYQVAIRGNFPRIFFNFQGDKDKILSIDQWGDIAWSSMERAFRGCTNLGYTATDAPDLTNVTSLSSMFARATMFNGELSTWDVSSITDMSSMFHYATSFNGDISTWDVSSVTSMSKMFESAISFIGNINVWDVSSVANMSYMFRHATSFNGDLNTWDVSSVTSMRSMFSSASSFNGDISAWDVSNVTDMGLMFRLASSFNGDISAWDVSNVTDMGIMFANTYSFNGDLSDWDVSSATSMFRMFYRSTSFNGDISAWDVSNVTSMGIMFEGAESFNSNLSSWNVSSVSDMSRMFRAATSFNQDLSAWNIEGVGNMDNMLDHCGMDMINYDKTLNGWASQNVQHGVPLGATGLEYCAGAAARYDLINDHGWIIQGDSNNCPCDFLFTITSQHTSCGQENGEITLTPQGGTEPFSYSLNGTSITFPATELASGTYTIFGIDANQCTHTIIVTIDPSQDIDLTFVATDRTCGLANGEIDATVAFVNGDVTYTIDGTPTTMPVTGLDVGTYTMVATDADGCQYTEDVTIGGSDALVLTYTSTPSNCGLDDGTIDYTLLAGENPITFFIDDVEVTMPVTGLAPGLYFIAAIDANGCNSQLQVTVGDNPIPSPTITGETEMCSGATTTLEVGDFAAYAWSTGETTQTIDVQPTETTTYTVLVTDSNGCTATAEITVEVTPIEPPIVFGFKDICIGEYTRLIATGYESYLWSNGDTTPYTYVSPEQTTTYQLHVTNADGCSASTEVIIEVIDPVDTKINGDLYLCPGESTTLEVEGGDRYRWSTGEDTYAITVRPEETTVYSVTVYDDTYCPVTKDVTVTVYDSPTPHIYGNLEVCKGSSTTLDAGAYASYMWSTGDTTRTITVHPDEDTNYTVSIIDENGCKGMASAEVKLVDQLTPIIRGHLDICEGDSTTLDAGAYTSYLWSTGDTTRTITVHPTEDTEYSVWVMNETGCDGKGSTTVKVSDELSPEIDGNLTICEGMGTVLTVGSYDSYTWSHGATGARVMVKPQTTTTYTVEVRNGDNCVGTDTVVVTVLENPTMEILGDARICEGESTTLYTGDYAAYRWSTGSTESSISVSPSETTTYGLTVWDENGCAAEDSIVVYVRPAPVPRIYGRLKINKGESTTLRAYFYRSYKWSTGSTRPSITVQPNETTTYTLDVTDIYGCKGVATVTVIVDSVEDDTPIDTYIQSPHDGTHTRGLEDRTDAIHVYPNPTAGKVEIRSEAGVNIEHYAIYTATGHLVDKGKNLPQEIDLSEYGIGVYLMHLHTDLGLVTKRVIVTR